MNWAERHERIFPWEFVQKEPVGLGREPGREGRREVFLKAMLRLKAGILGLM